MLCPWFISFPLQASPIDFETQISLRTQAPQKGPLKNISPGAYIFQMPFLRGLCTEGNLRLKIDQASLILDRKFTVFSLFYFVFEGNFQVQAPQGAYIWRSDLTKGFFALRVLEAYIWRGLYMEGLIFGSLWYVLLILSM